MTEKLKAIGLNAYPEDMQELIRYDHTTELTDANSRNRAIFIEGYKQALADVRAKAEEYHTEISEGKVDCDGRGFLMMACYENIIDFIDEQRK